MSSIDADSVALDALVPLVLDELRQLAHRHLAAEGDHVTLQTTELVHEAYLRLANHAAVAQRGRAYFFASASQAMRRVLVDAARRRLSVKRGAGAPMVSLGEAHEPTQALAADLLALDDALAVLERRNPRHARVVQCRYFGGMSVEETAEALGVSPRTVKADWAFSRAWLADQFTNVPSSPAPHAG